MNADDSYIPCLPVCSSLRCTPDASDVCGRNHALSTGIPLIIGIPYHHNLSMLTQEVVANRLHVLYTEREGGLQNHARMCLDCRCFGGWQAISSRLKWMTKETREGGALSNWCSSSCWLPWTIPHIAFSYQCCSHISSSSSFPSFFPWSFVEGHVEGEIQSSPLSHSSFVMVVWKWSKWWDVTSDQLPFLLHSHYRVLPL